jgi:hypothetical protein
MTSPRAHELWNSGKGSEVDGGAVLRRSWKVDEM